ncbi:hypothetical protein [Klebsiella pneumoniae]|uniref:hypothetical protein n=1 Tax=Klebsiella pneumoniae TaxID=573 RepID=UPI003217F9C0
MFNPKEINVTHHAMLRWTERGYMGNIGLFHELSKAEPLDMDAAKNSNDLQLYLHITNLFHKNQEDKVFLFAGWFIFILAGKELITCISRRPRSPSNKPRALTYIKSKYEKGSRQKRRAY